MNKSCEYCQYNGPYGSIINPCENCPNNDFMINDTFPIVQPLLETIEVPFTIGDKIRSMSDEEIAIWLNAHVTDTVCDLVCGNDCEAMATYDKTFDEVCKDLIKKKLTKEWHE